MTTVPIMDELNDEKEGLPGAQLAVIRESKGLTKEYIAGKLHLRVQVVDLLERDEYLKLPEPVFIKGYLRGYAKLLNLAPESYLLAFNNQFSPEKRPEKALWQSSRESHRGETMVRWITGLIVLSAIVVAYLWWQKDKTAQLFPIASTPEKSISIKTASKTKSNLSNTAQMQSLFSSSSDLDSEETGEKIDG